MIYTVTVNPAMDYFLEFEAINIAKTNRAQATRKLPGGKGIVESRMLARLGTENTALGFVGGFPGEFIRAFLEKENIKTAFTKISDETRINVKVKTGNQETEFNALGPKLTDLEINDFLSSFEHLKQGDIVVLAGKSTANLGADFYARLIDIIKSHGADFAIDVEGKDLLEALSESPIVIKPNKSELEEIFAVKFHQKEEIIPYGKKMLEMGAQHVIVSMAGEGALLFTKEKTYFAEPVKGIIKNSVGAGDSTVAGFLSEWSKSADALSAFHQGIACGTAKVFSEDMPSTEFLENCYQKIQIKEI